MNQLILAVLALVLGAGLCLLNVGNRVRAALGLFSQAVAMVLVWSVAIPVLMGGPEITGGISWAYPIGALHFRLDALGVDIGSRSVEVVGLAGGEVVVSLKAPTAFDPAGQCARLLEDFFRTRR